VWTRGAVDSGTTGRAALRSSVFSCSRRWRRAARGSAPTSPISGRRSITRPHQPPRGPARAGGEGTLHSVCSTRRGAAPRKRARGLW
jgi:hypothetical protein